MQSPDRLLRGTEALVNNSIFEVDYPELSVPASSKQHVTRLIVQHAVDRICELEHEVADSFLSVPLADRAVIRA